MSIDLTWLLLIIGSIYCVYLAGHIAERRGRSFKNWACVAAMIGPLALPLVYLFPNLQDPKLQDRNGDHA